MPRLLGRIHRRLGQLFRQPLTFGNPNSAITRLAILTALTVSVAVTLPRFLPGIPMGIDTTSHLYRVLFLHKWLSRGVFPFWNPDWYAGTPLLLLYPPLSYLIPVQLSAHGIDPLLSYKIVDATFYCIAPVTVYCLGKEFGFRQVESAIGAACFSLMPVVIDNYLLFDRFPTVVCVPVFCGFLILFHRAVTSASDGLAILGSVFLLSALVVTHHLSAAIAGAVAAAMTLAEIGKRGSKRTLMTLAVVAVGTLGLTAFWSIPFLLSMGFLEKNPFFNRNTMFPYVGFGDFSYYVVWDLLGVVPFIMAVIGTQLILNEAFGRRIRPSAMTFLVLLIFGMLFFQLGEALNYSYLTAFGQLVVIQAFVAFLAQFALTKNLRSINGQVGGQVFMVLWFILFLWIGLGYYVLPVLWLPWLNHVWMKAMDVTRVWLYAAIPVCLVGSRSLFSLWSRKRGMAFFLITIALVGLMVQLPLTVHRDLSSPVNSVLPYTASNAQIPSAIIDYFRNDSASGRILGINLPFWLYVLPSYVDKPILDGWYPQSKLITPLIEINDYRINDLESATSQSVRISTWKTLIAQGRSLWVTWVMIAGRSLAQELTKNTSYVERLSVPYESTEIVVFKATETPAYVETTPANCRVLTSRPEPDTIDLVLDSTEQGCRVILKEAYFPTWSAMANGRTAVMIEDQTLGFIVLEVPARTSQVTIYQKTTYEIWELISCISAAICVLAGIAVYKPRKPAMKCM